MEIFSKENYSLLIINKFTLIINECQVEQSVIVGKDDIGDSDFDIFTPKILLFKDLFLIMF